VTSLGYGGVTNAARYVARTRGATVREVALAHAGTSPDAVVEAISAALGERTRLAIVDHIASNSALLLPIAAVAERCRGRGVPILVDGAHAPGAIALDLPSTGADWYVGNLHKWAWAPRSSAFLWVRPEHQATLHPAVISWGLDQGFTTEFDLVGTRDPSPWLAAPAALELLAEFGAEEVRGYNHDLAFRAGERLAERFETDFRTPRSMVATMVSVPREVDELAADATGVRQIETAEAVFVGGGNTFRLLKTLQETELLAPLRERAQGGMPYLGASAGINLAGPTIRTTNDMPIVEPRGFDALGLVPFQINPHYLDPEPGSTHMGETRAERLAEFHEENATAVVGLREGAWIRVEGVRAWLGGARGARIFRRGREPEERGPGAALDDLV
jgi:peptidase E